VSAATVILAVALALSLGALGALGALHLGRGRRPLRRARRAGPASRRIAFPYTARALSHSALDAALRLAVAEDATLMPVFLARVPLRLPLDAPLPRQAAVALPLQEAIEQRAARAGVAVEQRIERGRSYRHALRHAFEHERFERMVLAAAPPGEPGLGAEDVAWVLAHAPGEIIVLRPAPARTQPRRTDERSARVRGALRGPGRATMPRSP
jgi:hypothetical protein